MSALTREPASITELMAVKPEVCIRHGDLFSQETRTLFPGITQVEYPDLGMGTDERGDLGEQLESGVCNAILAPTINYRFWVNADEWMSCNTRIAQKPVTARAGYVAPLENWCVARAIDYALEGVRLRGLTYRLAMEWFPPRSCSGPSSSNGGRRLASSSTAKGGAAGGGATAPAARGNFGEVDEAQQINRMDIEDFLGIFALWGVATVISLLVVPVKVFLDRRALIKKAKGKEHAQTSEEMEDEDAQMSEVTSAADHAYPASPGASPGPKAIVQLHGESRDAVDSVAVQRGWLNTQMAGITDGDSAAATRGSSNTRNGQHKTSQDGALATEVASLIAALIKDGQQEILRKLEEQKRAYAAVEWVASG